MQLPNHCNISLNKETLPLYYIHWVAFSIMAYYNAYEYFNVSALYFLGLVLALVY